jgi:hypothetical protein
MGKRHPQGAQIKVMGIRVQKARAVHVSRPKPHSKRASVRAVKAIRQSRAVERSFTELLHYDFFHSVLKNHNNQ